MQAPLAEYVATSTFEDERIASRARRLVGVPDDYPEVVFEEGGVYELRFRKPPIYFRPFSPNERTLACPRCGRRFASNAPDGMGAKQALEMHVDGDEEMPSIC